MATKLSDGVIQELSLVFAKKDGAEWAPRNPEARVLGTKAGPTIKSDKAKAAWFDKFVATVKGWYTDGPVVGEVPDNIDGDGDGASDYNAIVALITSMYYDLQNATWINDDGGRSAGVVAIVDSFLKQLDAMRSGSEEAGKAGKRHSAADQGHIDAIAAAHDKLGKALAAAGKAQAAIGEHVTSLQPADPASTDDGDADDESDAAKAALIKTSLEQKAGDVGEDGAPVNAAHLGTIVAQLREKCKDEPALLAAVNKASDEPYGDVEYADDGLQSDGKKRYPIDTKAHAKSAWSYINKESNAEKYSASDLAKVKAKIKAACEKFGVEISDDDTSKAAAARSASSTTEVDMTEEQLNAAIAKAAQDAATAAATAVKAELRPQIDTAKAEAEAARKDAEKAQKDAEQAQTAQKAAEDKLNGAARTATSKSGDVNANKGESSLQRAIKAANSGSQITVQGAEVA